MSPAAPPGKVQHPAFFIIEIDALLSMALKKFRLSKIISGRYCAVVSEGHRGNKKAGPSGPLPRFSAKGNGGLTLPEPPPARQAEKTGAREPGGAGNGHHGGPGRPGRHPHPGLETLHPRGGHPGVADTLQATGRLAIQFYTNPYYPPRGTPHHKLIRLSTKLSPALNVASFSYLIAVFVRCELSMDRFYPCQEWVY